MKKQTNSMVNTDSEIQILFAGDFIPCESPTSLFSDELLQVLRNKDFSFVNLEAPLTDAINPILKNGNNFKLSPVLTKKIKEGFFDAVTLSNNHIRDYGDKGVLDTLNYLKEEKIQTVGAGINEADALKPLRLSIKGRSISVLNYSEHEFNLATNIRAGANGFDPIRAYYQIKEEKTKNDFVIVIYHGGIEYQHYPTVSMVDSFKFLVDIGADCIISHHTHRYSGSIIYKNKPIVFGLGNFLCPTKSKSPCNWLIGLLAVLKINGDSLTVNFIPTKMNEDFRKVSFLTEELRDNVYNHIKEITSVIENKEQLSDYWAEYFSQNQKQIINLLNSGFRLEYLIRKHLPDWLNPAITAYRLSSILNFARCQSLRDKLISSFEMMYEKRSPKP